MYSAILLAGYNNKRAVEKYRSIVENDYGEHYIEKDYKPLHEFTLHKKGKTITKPLIQFTLEVLIDHKEVEEIVIVGHREKLQNRLSAVLANSEKPIVLIDQSAPFTEQMVDLFKINTKETPYDSIGGNLIKAYYGSKACQKGESALFCASDSPLTTATFISHFLKLTREAKNASIYLPAVYTDPKKDKMGRVPLLLYNDTEYEIKAPVDRWKRNGFRLSSIMVANPLKLDVNMINVIYSIRKALNPKIQLRIFRICREVGYPRIYSRYFLKKNLTIVQGEQIFSAFLSTHFKAIVLKGVESTFDFDGTEEEYEEISRMLDQ